MHGKLVEDGNKQINDEMYFLSGLNGSMPVQNLDEYLKNRQ